MSSHHAWPSHRIITQLALRSLTLKTSIGLNAAFVKLFLLTVLVLSSPYEGLMLSLVGSREVEGGHFSFYFFPFIRYCTII